MSSACGDIFKLWANIYTGWTPYEIRERELVGNWRRDVNSGNKLDKYLRYTVLNDGTLVNYSSRPLG